MSKAADVMIFPVEIKVTRGPLSCVGTGGYSFHMKGASDAPGAGKTKNPPAAGSSLIGEE
jgi:hypothetical protein